MSRPSSRPTPPTINTPAPQAFDEPSTLEEWQAHAHTLEKVQRVGRLGYWKMKLSTEAVYWSGVVYEIFGVDSTTFAPDRDAFLAMVHPQDREKLAEKLKRTRVIGRHEITYRIIQPDGTIHWLHEIADNTSPDDPDVLLGTIRDITVFKELEQKLRKQAITDDLTGIFNRRYFMKRLKHAFAHYQRSGHRAVVLLMDIDHFKIINDTYGHGMGDRVLKRFCGLFKERFRQTDVAGRLGGEEFAVLLFEISVKDAAKVAGKIREALANMTFTTDADEKFHVSVTCGVAGFSKDDETEDSILQRADDSLYLGKRSGRNQVVTENPATVRR